MPYTDEQLQQLYGDLAHSNYAAPPPAPPTKEEEEVNEIKYKRIKQLANIGPKAVGSIASGLVGINEMLFPDEDFTKDIAAAKHIAPSFSVGEDKGLLDVALNTVAPEIAAFMVPYTGALKVAKSAQAGRAGMIATEGIGQGIGGFLQKSDEPTGGIETGALGGISGALQVGLPRLGWAGRLAPLAGVSTAYGAATDNWGEAALNLGANMLPGAFKGVTKPVLASSKFAGIADEFIPPTQPVADLSHIDTSGMRLSEGLPPPSREIPFTNDPDISHLRTTEYGLTRGEIPQEFSPSGMSLADDLTPLPRSEMRLNQDEFIPNGAENAVRHLNNDALLRLEGQNLVTQELDPLLSMQSAGSIKSGGINFSMVDNPSVRSIDPTGELSHWRNAAANRSSDTLLLESPKTVITSPRKVPDLFNPTQEATDTLTESVRARMAGKPPTPKSAWDLETEAILNKSVPSPKSSSPSVGETTKIDFIEKDTLSAHPGGQTVQLSNGKIVKIGRQFGSKQEWYVISGNDLKVPLGTNGSLLDATNALLKVEEAGGLVEEIFKLPKDLSNSARRAMLMRKGKADAKARRNTAIKKVEEIVSSEKEEIYAVESQLADGTRIKGVPGQTHFQLDIPPGEELKEGFIEGFTTKSGKFVNRDQAADLTKAKGRARSEDLVSVPKILTSTGKEVVITPKQEGPHIISTVVHDKGLDKYLVGDKWNSPHQKGDDSIYMQHIATSSGDVKSAFAVVDFDGNTRVITRGLNKEDDALLGKIAKAAGQVPEGHAGNLQSEDLIEQIVKTKPKVVEQHIAAEAIVDSKILEYSKKLELAKNEVSQAEQFAAEMMDDPVLSEMAKGDLFGAKAKLAKLMASEAGFAVNPAMVVLAASGIGGLVTYQQTKGDMGATIAAAIIIAGLGFGGTAAFKNLSKLKGPKPLATTIKIPHETIKEKLIQFAIETKSTPAGLAVGGRGGIHAGAMLAAESYTGLNRIAAFKDGKIKGDGFISLVLDDLVGSLRKVAKVIPTPAFSQAAGKFLRGQLSDPVEVQNLLNSGGIISGEGGAWSKLSFKQREAYPERWLQLDDANNTNLKGDGVTIWHVTNSVKQQLLKNEKDALLRQALTPDDKAFSEYAINARKAIDILQAPIFAAAGPKEGARIIGTMGQYTTRSHALLTDPKFYPAEPEIASAMAKLATAKVGNFLSSVGGPGPGAVSRSWGGVDHWMSPGQADNFDNLYTPESLRAVVTQRIKEIKQIGAQQKAGLFSHDEAQFAGHLFSGRKELDDVTQALLGTHNAPHEMIRDTINKLIPAARSAHVMLDLTAAVEKSGLPGRFTSEVDYSKALNSLKRQLTSTVDPRKQQVIQNQLDELSAYLPIGTSNPSMGLFQGSFVSRHVHSQLDEMMNPLGMFEDVIGTGLRTFNNAFKETHLVLNPVTQARNFMQIPAMLVIGRAAHDFQAIKTAYNIIYKGDRTSAISRWAIENGVTAGNAVHGELNFGMKQLMSGEADTFIGRLVSKHTTETTAIGAFKKGHLRAAAHLAYAKPDDFVRAATFVAAARRSAKRLGVAEDVMHLNKQVTDEAREFMARRSMDYANVPQWVKIGRQIPLVTPFLTYSHEIVRITGNMAIDAAKGDLVSGAGLAALSTLPFLAQGMAEDALSPEDKKAWLKGQAAAQDYSRPRFKLPGSRNSDGTFNYYDITPLMPFGDYMMMGRAIKEGDMSAVAAVNPILGIQKAPLTNLIAEQVMGKDIHTQREFRTSWDRARNILQEITPPWIPGIGADAEKNWPEWMGGKLGQTNMKTGRTATIKGALMRNILGVDESQVNPDIAIANMIKGAQRDISNERAYLRDAMMSKGLSTEGKQRAAARYAEAVKHIADQIAERINPPTI